MLAIKHLNIQSTKDGFLLVNDLSIVLNPGDKCAIIGEEGTGKSTLLKSLIDPTLIPYATVFGDVVMRGKVGYLEQDIHMRWHDVKIEDYLLLKHPKDTIDPRDYATLRNLSKVLDTVRFPKASFDVTKTMAQFSGGEIVKLGLAKLLLHACDILLLDEPTNDLDFETIVFLESFIQSQDKTVLFISHDERLLENTATSIIHLMRVKKKQTAITHVEKMSYGEYKRYRLNKDEHQSMIARKKRADYQKKIARFQAIYQSVAHAQNQAVRVPSEARLLAKKMKQLKATKKRYEKEANNFEAIPEVPKPLDLLFPQTIHVPNGKTVIDFTCPKLMINNHILSQQITLLLKGPAKIVITGKNGVGKTTLLHEIYNHMRRHSDLKTGYMPQTYDALESSQSVLEFLNVQPDGVIETRVRKMLGAIGFEREEMVAPTKQLSGGQKAKLYLLKLVIEQKEVLILDEPTRNLSPLSAPEIYHLLNTYQGAVICVTHDRTFIESVFDALYILTESGLKMGA